MDWRAKAAMHAVVSRAPWGGELNYLLQRRVTRSLPPPDGDFREVAATARSHVAAYRDNGPGPLQEARFFEFGAGWEMGVPLALAGLGVTAQTVVDVRRLTRTELIRHTLDRFDALDLVDLPPPPTGAPSVAELLAHYGIDYRAPCDARRTGLPASSVDCVTSTSTLEHVPAEDVVLVAAECLRLLRPGGLMSSWIDYQDHYASFDPRIGVYNFLRYDDRAWRKFSPRLHHQNRLRHADYMARFRSVGFEVVLEETSGGGDGDLADIGRLQLAAEFAGRSPADLAVRGARVVLRKPEGVRVGEGPA